jgi:hypothetical protein
MLVYFVFVLGIGVALKRYMKTSTDFFLAGRSIPAWVCGLAFISANLGAQEVIGMGASGAKYGIATSHFYWIGAIPAMVFVGVFMMPFYYGSRARSVPEYLRLRFDEKTRGSTPSPLPFMTVFSSGISMYAMAKLIQILHVFDVPFQHDGPADAWIFHVSSLVSASSCWLHLARRPDQRHLQRGAAVLPDRRRVSCRWSISASRRGRMARLKAKRCPATCPLLAGHGARPHQPAGRGMVRPGDGPGLRALVRLLVHQLSRRPARHGRRLHERRAPHAADRRLAQDALSVPGHPAGTDRHLAAHRCPVGQDVATNPAVRRSVAGRPPMDEGPHPRSRSTRNRHAAPRPTASRCWTTTSPSRTCCCITSPPACWAWASPRCWPASCQAWRATSPPSTPCGPTTSTSPTSTRRRQRRALSLDGPHGHHLRHRALGRAAYMATRFNNIMDMLQLVFAFVNAPLFATFLLGMFWKRTTGHGAFTGCSRAPRRGSASRPDPARGRHSPASRADGSALSTPIPARWRRTSGPPSGPGPPASSSPSSSAWS